MLNVDATIGDASQLALVTKIHLFALALIVVVALLALRDPASRRYRHFRTVSELATARRAAGTYVSINAGLIAHAAGAEA